VIPAAVETESYGVFELKIPAKAEWVAVARLAIAAVASRLRFSVDEIEDIKLAIAEACTHCIQHATGSDAIEITCEALSDSVHIIVRDRGTAPRIEDVDKVEYTTDAKNGTELRMIKYVSV
jgi:serine/threonine-protein kinase RsbW